VVLIPSLLVVLCFRASLNPVALLLNPVAQLLNPVAAYHIRSVCPGIRIHLVIATQMIIMHHRAPTFLHLIYFNLFAKLKLFLVFAMPSPTHLGPLSPLPPASEYATLADIKAALQAYARNNGYAIAADSSTPTRAYWICSKGGKYNDKNKSHDTHPTKRR
jgi:hypothetical protein